MTPDTGGVPTAVDDVPTARLVTFIEPVTVDTRCQCGASVGTVDPSLIRVIVKRRPGFAVGHVYVVRCPACNKV